MVPKASHTEAADFVENLVVSPSVPEAILNHLAMLLINVILSAETSLKERQLLSMIQQRHPQVVQKVTQEIIEEDDDKKDAVEELIISLSTTQAVSASTKDAASLDLIVSSTHADVNVRAIAVKKLIASLPREVESDDFVCSTLFHPCLP